MNTTLDTHNAMRMMGIHIASLFNDLATRPRGMSFDGSYFSMITAFSGALSETALAGLLEVTPVKRLKAAIGDMPTPRVESLLSSIATEFDTSDWLELDKDHRRWLEDHDAEVAENAIAEHNATACDEAADELERALERLEELSELMDDVTQRVEAAKSRLEAND